RSEGLPVLVYASNGFPHFRSSKKLEDGQEVEILITNKTVWEVEAGEDILAGEAVYAGEEGKHFSRKSGEDKPTALIGDDIHKAHEADCVQFVRSVQINGNWAKQVNDRTDGDSEDDAEKRLLVIKVRRDDDSQLRFKRRDRTYRSKLVIYSCR